MAVVVVFAAVSCAGFDRKQCVVADADARVKKRAVLFRRGFLCLGIDLAEGGVSKPLHRKVRPLSRVAASVP